MIARIALAARLARERRAVAATEFAIILPVLLLLYLGGFQLTDAIGAYRKVTTTVRALADLSTQSEQVTPSEMAGILAGARQIMTPYSTAGSTLYVVAIDFDAQARPSITWVCAQTTTSSCGTSYAGVTVDSLGIPAALKVANTSLLYSSLSYRYVPAVGGGFVSPIQMGDRLFMSPRRSPAVCLNRGTPTAPQCVGKGGVT
ncbi:Flp pilus assembly protein TadG [Sphingomonas sp. BE138]|uniref:TadE/TadG family type IV pilus assembly protein n=1 Tax=Sphingomonas sp. BE138 TaxID=2817845 RepID=UPI00286612A1|nr:TadE/TadG family type IV pilus assembly protein [Sphingomonas sp. BE138]MDR6790539.1 Flp pilus assembly protein TadG [Sphingomonas sp. BE138]